VGLLLLVATALSMMLTIDRTLNGIWRVRRPRPLAQRILVYWAALTLGPLAIGVSLSPPAMRCRRRGAGRCAAGRRELHRRRAAVRLLAAAMAGLFHYVPNTFVRWRARLGRRRLRGAGLRGGQGGLAWYVESMGTFSAVYGAFATLPILLLWIYLGWVIVLLGAVIAAYAPSLQMRVVRRPDEPGARFTLALELLGQLQRARQAGAQGLTLHRWRLALRQDPLQIESVLDRLVELGWVGRLDEQGAQRHVLLGEPHSLLAGPLVEALLLAPAAADPGLCRPQSGCSG
jgi:membrane protein